MTSAEFAEWQAFQALEGPLGERREDWRAALVASVIANAHRDPKRTKRAYEPDDFVPDWAAHRRQRRTPAVEVADKVKALLHGLAARARARGQA